MRSSLSEGELMGLTFTAPPIARQCIALRAGAREGAGAVFALFAGLTGLQACDGGQGTLIYVCKRAETSQGVSGAPVINYHNLPMSLNRQYAFECCFLSHHRSG